MALVLDQPGCRDCPLRGDGLQSFIPDTLRDSAPILKVGDDLGPEWEQKYLKGAGLSLEGMSLARAIRCNLKELPLISTIQAKDALAHCQRAHGRIPDGTRLIVTQGDFAATLHTGTTVTGGDDSTGWRGYLQKAQTSGPVHQPGAAVSEYFSPDPRDLCVLVTYDESRIRKEPWLTIATKRDWAKVPAILQGKWPKRPPKFVDRAPATWPEMFAFDTEWDRETKELLRYSMSWGTEDGETAVVERADHEYPQHVGRSRVVTQYAPADVEHLDRLSRFGGGLVVELVIPVQVLESVRDPVRGDVVVVFLPDTGMVNLCQSSVWERFLIEDTVWKHSTLWSDHRHDLNYLASVYGPFNRWKHLSEANPRLYAGMDAVGLLYIDRALERELNADPLSRRVWEEIDRPALRVFVQAQYRGLRTNRSRVLQVKDLLTGQMAEAAVKAQAISGRRTMNIGSDKQVGHRLYEVEGL